MTLIHYESWSAHYRMKILFLRAEVRRDFATALRSVKNGAALSGVLGITEIEQDALHVVIGYKETTIIIITAYKPSAKHWMPDNKTRRK